MWKNKQAKTDIMTVLIVVAIVYIAFFYQGGLFKGGIIPTQSGASGDTSQANPTSTVQIVGAPCTQATTLTVSTVRRYTEVAQTGENATILQNGVLKGTFAHLGTTTVQSGANGDNLELFPGLQSTTFYPRHFKGKITTCTGAATTGDVQYFTEVNDATVGGAKITYNDADGIYSASPNKLVQIDTSPTITIVNDGQANQNTGGQGQGTGSNLTIGTGGSGSVTVKLSPGANSGWGVNGNVLACQFPAAVYDSANPLIVTVPGSGVLQPASITPSSTRYPLINANNTVKTYQFPGIDSRKTGDLTFSVKPTADQNHDPAGANDRINCTLADVSYYQKQNSGAYVLDIENRDTNVELGGANTVYDWEIGVA